MSNDKKLIALDLDETLLNKNHLVSERSVDAIRRAKSAGWHVVIASGRMHESTLPFASQLDLDGPVISYNGALVKVRSTGEEWLHDRVPETAAAQVLKFCAQHQLQLNFYYDGMIYTENDTPWLQLYHGRTGSPYTITPGLVDAMAGKEPTKLLIVDTPEYTNSLVEPFRERFDGVLYVTKTTDEYLEFMPVSANKGRALALVAARLGIDQSNTVAIGDSYNDIPMVDWAGKGVAVGNARPALKAVADEIVDTNDEDGVAKVIEALLKA